MLAARQEPIKCLDAEELSEVLRIAKAEAAKNVNRMIRFEQRNRQASRLMLGNSPVFC